MVYVVPVLASHMELASKNSAACVRCTITDYRIYVGTSAYVRSDFTTIVEVPEFLLMLWCIRFVIRF